MQHCTAHTTTEQHQNKRRFQFQPSITSFFAPDDFDDGDLRGSQGLQRHARGPQQQQQQQHQQHPRRESLAPVVPEQVQADLLSVGMRIRKSVPEGYKTHKMVALPSLHTGLAKPMRSARNAGLEVKPPRGPVEDALLHQRELLPFCGLHKIGGYAEQPTTGIHLYTGPESHAQRPGNVFPLTADAFTQPFFSSHETSPPRPNPTNPSKRSWQDEDETLNPNYFFGIPMKMSSGDDEVPVSPLSETPPDLLPPVRLFAQPKSRRRAVGSRDVDMVMETSEHGHIEGRVATGCSSDFEEADFLDGHEVDMGGV